MTIPKKKAVLGRNEMKEGPAENWVMFDHVYKGRVFNREEAKEARAQAHQDLQERQDQPGPIELEPRQHAPIDLNPEQHEPDEPEQKLGM